MSEAESCDCFLSCQSMRSSENNAAWRIQVHAMLSRLFCLLTSPWQPQPQPQQRDLIREPLKHVLKVVTIAGLLFPPSYTLLLKAMTVRMITLLDIQPRLESTLVFDYLGGLFPSFEQLHMRMRECQLVTFSSAVVLLSALSRVRNASLLMGPRKSLQMVTRAGPAVAQLLCTTLKSCFHKFLTFFSND